MADQNNQYLTFAPRGLQYITISKLRSLLSIISISVLEDETSDAGLVNKWKAQIQKEELKRKIRKERKKKRPKGDFQRKFDVDRKERDDENRRKINAMQFTNREDITSSTTDKERDGNKEKVEDVVGCTSLVDGTNISIGYYSTTSASQMKKNVWSMPGQTEGLVPIIFTTSSTYEDVAMIRGMGCGPLLALVTTTAPTTKHFEKNDHQAVTEASGQGSKEDGGGSPVAKKAKTDEEMISTPLEINYAQSLNEASASILQYLQQEYHYEAAFDKAVKLWYNHVINVWHNGSDLYGLHGENSSKNIEEKKEKMKVERERIKNSFAETRNRHQKGGNEEEQLQYRLSCVRTNGKKYSYKKEDLLPLISPSLLPSEFTSTENNNKKWSVNLVNFDLEVVLFVHTSPPNPMLIKEEDENKNGKMKVEEKQQHYVTIALNLRPYNKFSTMNRSSNRSWYASSHLPPRDIIPPLVSVSPSFQNQEDILVKLRPSTAQLLLAMANIKMGDVVLDPCGGVGTIPIEGALLQNGQRCVNFGGDIVLQRESKEQQESAIRSTARNYASSTQQYKQKQERQSKQYFGISELSAWDASLLPLRNSSIDVIVSDLPFGQRCLSTHRLSALLPLIFYEFGRVLRDGKNGGRMVLLCGAHEGVVDAITELNECSYYKQQRKDERKEQQNKKEEDKKQKQHSEDQVFITPLESIFPVNIGGLSAWVIIARRGNGVAEEPSNYRSRVQKLTSLRERQMKHEQSAAATSKRKENEKKMINE